LRATGTRQRFRGGKPALEDVAQTRAVPSTSTHEALRSGTRRPVEDSAAGKPVDFRFRRAVGQVAAATAYEQARAMDGAVDPPLAFADDLVREGRTLTEVAT